MMGEIAAQPGPELKDFHQKPVAGARRETYYALLCAAIVTAAWLSTWPFGNLPFNDDWSYACTTFDFLKTGKVIYNGWSSPILLPQVWWGALFCRWFGASYVVLRWSTLPLAAMAVALCYLLARRANLRPGLAVFAALAMGLSPMFLPLATSFMTDVPGLFFLLLSLYLLVRAAEATRTVGAAAWLVAGFVVGLVGGMDRQIVWVVPLAVTPYLAIVRRREKALVILVALGWVAVLAGAVEMQRWFYRQPLAVHEMPLRELLKLMVKNHRVSLEAALGLYLTTVMLALPAGVLAGGAILRQIRERWLGPYGMWALIVGMGVLALLWELPIYAKEPFLPNLLAINGIVGDFLMHGPRPIQRPAAAREAIGLATLVAGALLLVDVLARVADRQTWAGIKQVLFSPERGRFVLMAMALMAGPYVAIVLLHAGRGLVFDRYALPLTVLLTIALLARAGRPSGAAMGVAVALLAVYAAYAIASTQEVQALARARAAALQRLAAAGVKRTQINGGLEYNALTQVQLRGYVNNPELQYSSSLYRKGLPLATEVHPEYRIEFAPAEDSAPTQFGSVEYFSLVPPFHRRIYIDRILVRNSYEDFMLK